MKDNNLSYTFAQNYSQNKYEIDSITGEAGDFSLATKKKLSPINVK